MQRAQAKRIAYLVTHHDPKPITIDVGIPEFGFNVSWVVQDGNHRVAAFFPYSPAIEASVSGGAAYAQVAGCVNIKTRAPLAHKYHSGAGATNCPPSFFFRGCVLRLLQRDSEPSRDVIEGKGAKLGSCLVRIAGGYPAKPGHTTFPFDDRFARSKLAATASAGVDNETNMKLGVGSGSFTILPERI